MATDKKIAKTEDVDVLVVELGALLHDIADSKFHNGDETIGPRMARDFLVSIGLEQKIVEHVELIIANISFKNTFTSGDKFFPLELAVVQDADRLDAMGAIGIARTFAYGGLKGKELYNPEILARLDMTKDEYKNSTAPSFNHFQEKLILLKDKLNTDTGKELGVLRHKHMECFVEQFLAEWEGSR